MHHQCRLSAYIIAVGKIRLVFKGKINLWPLCILNAIGATCQHQSVIKSIGRSAIFIPGKNVNLSGRFGFVLNGTGNNKPGRQLSVGDTHPPFENGGTGIGVIIKIVFGFFIDSGISNPDYCLSVKIR